MALTSASFSIHIVGPIEMHSSALGGLLGESRKHGSLRHRSTRLEEASVIEFAHVSSIDASGQLLEEAIQKSTECLAEISSTAIGQIREQGLEVLFVVGGWLDAHNQLDNLVLSPAILKELGRLGVSMEFCINDHHR